MTPEEELNETIRTLLSFAKEPKEYGGEINNLTKHLSYLFKKAQETAPAEMSVIFANDHPLFVCFGMTPEEILAKCREFESAAFDKALIEAKSTLESQGMKFDLPDFVVRAVYSDRVYYHVHNVPTLKKESKDATKKKDK